MRIDPAGEPLADVARRLGLHYNTLWYGLKQGIFDEINHVPRWLGKPGKPTPFVTSASLFDPSSSSLARPPDPVWGSLWQSLAERVPRDFEQVIQRTPHFARRTNGPHFTGWMWSCPGCRVACRLVFLPLPPLNLPEYFGLEGSSRSPAPRLIGDADALPAPPMTFACLRCHGVQYFSRFDHGSWNRFIAYLSAGLLYGSEVAKPNAYHKPSVPKPRPRSTPPASSGGFPFPIERQVHRRPRSALQDPRNRRKRKTRQRHRASPTRDAVQARLLAGHTWREIADELGITVRTVDTYASKIYRLHGVHSRAQLQALFNVRHVAEPLSRRPAVNARREKVREMMKSKVTYAEMARRLGEPYSRIKQDVYAIRKHAQRGRCG